MIRPQHDLFGEVVPPPVVRRKPTKQRKIGYAARPGTGPKGQRCGTCKYPQKILHAGITSHKCELMNHVWDHDARSDIHLRAPACSEWIRKLYKTPA